MCAPRSSVTIALVIASQLATLAAAQLNSTQTKRPQQTTPLTITILNLPAGAPARIAVGGVAGNVASLAKPGTLAVSPGSYSVTAAPVHVGNSTYYPTVPAQQVAVGARLSTVTVDYYNVVPDTTKVLDAEGNRTLLVSKGGTHISIAAGSATARSLRKNDVLVVGQTASTPRGVMVRILSVSARGNRFEAEVESVSFVEAITRGRLEGSLRVAPENSSVRDLTGKDQSWRNTTRARSFLAPQDDSATGCSGTRPAVELPFDLVLGAQGSGSIGPVGASGSVGLELSGRTDLCPELHLNIDWGFLKINSARVSASFGEDTSLTVTSEDSFSVSDEAELFEVKTKPYLIWVGNVPILLTGDATLSLGASVEGQSSFSTTTIQTANAELGLWYDHGKVEPIHNASFSIQPPKTVRSVTIRGKAYVALKLGVLVDEFLMPSFQPDGYVSWNSSTLPDLEIGLEGDVGVEVKVGKYGAFRAATPTFNLGRKTIHLGPDSPPPQPVLSLVTPNSATEGSPAQSLILTGQDFPANPVVLASGKALRAFRYSPNQLGATLPATEMLRTKTLQLQVLDPASGAASGNLPFTVTPINSPPVITSLDPWTLPAGSSAQTLTVNGKNFRQGATASFNSRSRPATYINDGQVSVSLTAGDLKDAGKYAVVVSNPRPDGGPSAPMNFAVLSTSPGSGEWTWVSGNNVASFSAGTYPWRCDPETAGIYGVKGIPSTTNMPGARSGATAWADSNGSFWLFGGEGCDTGGDRLFLNDLWRFDPANGVWTWISGSDKAGEQSVYGTLGVPASTNVPGAREEAASWTDTSGGLWMFGGYLPYPPGGGAGDSTNDLWRFDPGDAMWTWMGGSNSADQSGIYGTRGVPSSSNLPGGRLSPVSWTDAGGNFWLFGGNSWACAGVVILNDLWRFNRATATWTWLSGSNTLDEGRFCDLQLGVYGVLGVASPENSPGSRVGAVGWRDPSGTLWMFGGAGTDSAGNQGQLNDLWQFNPTSGMWTWTRGSETAGQQAVYGLRGYPASTNDPGARDGAVSWIDANGTVWLFGGDTSAGKLLSDLWQFNSASKMWTWASGPQFSNQAGTYGTKGTPSPANIPGARTGAASWIDPDGRLWIFGGLGRDSSGSVGYLNDLWVYKPQ